MCFYYPEISSGSFAEEQQALGFSMQKKKAKKLWPCPGSNASKLCYIMHGAVMGVPKRQNLRTKHISNLRPNGSSWRLGTGANSWGSVVDLQTPFLGPTCLRTWHVCWLHKFEIHHFYIDGDSSKSPLEWLRNLDICPWKKWKIKTNSTSISLESRSVKLFLGWKLFRSRWRFFSCPQLCSSNLWNSPVEKRRSIFGCTKQRKKMLVRSITNREKMVGCVWSQSCLISHLHRHQFCLQLWHPNPQTSLGLPRWKYSKSPVSVSWLLLRTWAILHIQKHLKDHHLHRTSRGCFSAIFRDDLHGHLDPRIMFSS